MKWGFVLKPERHSAWSLVWLSPASPLLLPHPVLFAFWDEIGAHIKMVFQVFCVVWQPVCRQEYKRKEDRPARRTPAHSQHAISPVTLVNSMAVTIWLFQGRGEKLPTSKMSRVAIKGSSHSFGLRLMSCKMFSYVCHPSLDTSEIHIIVSK